MKIEQWPIERVKPYEKNPRKNVAAVAKVKASLREFGWQQPIVVDEQGIIIAGHTRYKAAAELGQKTVPVLVAADLSPAQVKAYRLADNRTGEEAKWDYALLGEELADLKLADFDLDLVGFDESEMRSLMPDDANEAADELPEVEAVAISQLGDVWLLGDHRIICADCTDESIIRSFLGDDKPHLMVTDPPYGVEYDAAWRDESGLNKAHQKRATGKVLNDDRADWTAAWALFPGDVAYVWHGALHATVVADSLARTGLKVRSQIIWGKQTLVIGRGDYHWQHEPCWYVVREGAKGHWHGDRKQSTLWDIPNMHRTQGNVDDGKTDHSTQKPVECMKRPIENNSKKGDLVYEPFSGSGTTLVACELTGRKCRAVELNPIYVDLACRRFRALTGKPVVHAVTGEPFPD